MVRKILILSLVLIVLGCTSNLPLEGKVQLGEPAVDIPFITIDGEKMMLSDFAGEKVMLWFFSTWCQSCIKGAEVLNENIAQLENIQVIALQNINNGGYPSISVQEFVEIYAPETLDAKNWVWGEASPEAAFSYNGKGYSDIFFLIFENGAVGYANGAPASTLSLITDFAEEKSDD